MFHVKHRAALVRAWRGLVPDPLMFKPWIPRATLHVQAVPSHNWPSLSRGGISASSLLGAVGPSANRTAQAAARFRVRGC